jgi:hypothetical protein
MARGRIAAAAKAATAAHCSHGAEARLLASLPPDERSPDMLAMAAFRLMALKDAARTRKMAV